MSVTIPTMNNQPDPPPEKSSRTAQINFRTTPGLAAWLTDAAASAGTNRTEFMEKWLRLARDAVEMQREVESKGHPVTADELGDFLVGRMIGLGLAGGLAEASYQWRREREREDMEEWMREKAEKQGKAVKHGE